MRKPHVSTFGPPAAVAIGALLAGCEQPVRPANGPTPHQVAVSEALNVPVATIQAFDRDGLPAARGADPRPDPSSVQAQRLRAQLELLAQAHSGAAGATP